MNPSDPPPPQSLAAAPAPVEPDGQYSDDYDDNVVCERCGGEGFVEYLDNPDTWGEDCPSYENHLVRCPDCRGSGEPPKANE